MATQIFQSDSSATPAVSEILLDNNPETALSSMGEVATVTPHSASGSQKLEEQLGNARAGFESQQNITGILSGFVPFMYETEDDISQTHAGQNFDIKLQSVVRRVAELERRLGAVRDNRVLRRERIQLGLDVSVAGERGVLAPAFPFLMVFLSLIVVIAPSAFKYYAFSA